MGKISVRTDDDRVAGRVSLAGCMESLTYSLTQPLSQPIVGEIIFERVSRHIRRYYTYVRTQRDSVLNPEKIPVVRTGSAYVVRSEEN